MSGKQEISTGVKKAPLRIITKYFRQNPLMIFIIAIPLAIIAKIGGWSAMWIFALSTVAIIPMAGLIGQATESLAVVTGPKIGGLLNATLGNAAELIITLVAIKSGYHGACQSIHHRFHHWQHPIRAWDGNDRRGCQAQSAAL